MPALTSSHPGMAGSVNEAAKLIEINACSRDDIDKAVLLGLNYPRGIFRMADSWGIDTVVNELNRLYEKYNHEDRYKPSKLLTDMVKKGELGRKTGKGFYGTVSVNMKQLSWKRIPRAK